MKKPFPFASSAFRKTPLAIQIAAIATLLTFSPSIHAGASATYPYDGQGKYPYGIHSKLNSTHSMVALGGNDNTVTMTGNVNQDEVYRLYGGYTVTTTHSFNNTAKLIGGNVDNQVFGGYGYAPTHENIVYMSGGTVGVGDSNILETNNRNSVAVTGGRSHNSEAYNNTVNMSGGTVNGTVRGGSTYLHAGNVHDNIVNISEGHVVRFAENIANTGNVYGGLVTGNGAGNAENNTVTISGGTVDGHAIGGSAYTGNANNNTVTLKGGSVGDDVIGGLTTEIQSGGQYLQAGTATGNTVNIRDNAHLSATDTVIYGGYTQALANSPNDLPDVFTGNTLNLNNWQGSAKNIANFQTVNIDAPVVQNNAVILALTDTAGTKLGNGKTGADEVKTAVNLNSVAGGSVLNKGDRIHLIQNTAGGISGVNANDGQIKQGISALYDIQYVQDANNVDALILKGQVQEENKVLNEGRVASLAFLNSGADLITRENLRGKYVFGAIEGGHSRYDTGSSVDVDGVNLIVGANNVWQFASGDAQAGVFIEAGWGDTSTSNSIGGNHLNGNGNTHYYGAGLLGRYDWTNGAAKGMYVDGSLRAGRLSNDYSNKDLTDAQGHRASFDVDSTYYGAQAGIGYLWDMTPSYQLDMNARYTWTHVEGESANIAGDTFNFDSMDSHRTRLGARLNYTANPQFTPYAGLAWEYEFNGDAKGSVLGYSMDEASLGGSTGIVELGVQFMPSPKSNLTINAGVTGYFGQREGVAGNFRMNYAF